MSNSTIPASKEKKYLALAAMWTLYKGRLTINCKVWTIPHISYKEEELKQSYYKLILQENIDAKVAVENSLYAAWYIVAYTSEDLSKTYRQRLASN